MPRPRFTLAAVAEASRARMSLRIVFFGTPDFAVPTLTEIVGQGHEVAAVYTQPPRAAGRGMDERRSPVHDVADALRHRRS